MKFGKKKQPDQIEEAEFDKASLVLTKDETKWGRTKKWLKPVLIVLIILFILWELFASLVLPVLGRRDIIPLEKRKVDTFDFTPLAGVSLPAGVPEYMVVAAKKGEYTLCVCPEGGVYDLADGSKSYGSRGEFCVVKGDGEQIWFSNPQDRDSAEETAAGKFKWEMYSQLLITTYDNSTSTAEGYNSYWHASSDRADNAEGFEILGIEDGFVCKYHFSTPNVTVPLYVQLTDGGFKAFTLENQIKEKTKKDGTKRIVVCNVVLLPYFNSGSTQDEGYMLVPDGSGAIIEFNNGKNEGLSSNIAKYSVPIYGQDTALRYDYRSSGVYIPALPVYGVKNNDTSFAAIITEGDSAATVVAYTSGSKNLQNQVYPNFERYTHGTVTIGERGDWTAREVEKYYTKGAQFSVAEVNYLLLDKDAGYVEMADAVRGYMTDNAILVDREKQEDADDMPIFMNFIGGQYKTESVAGIPVNQLKVFTSVDNINEILDDFDGVGISNVVATYAGYNTKDIKSSKFVTDVRIPSGLGSVKKLRNLFDRLNGKLYLSYNPINLNSNGSGLTKNSDTAKSLSGSPVALYVYSVATGYAGAYSRGSSAITPLKFEELITNYLKNANGTGTNFGVYMNNEQTHYSNFSRTGFISREAYSIYQENMFTAATENNSVMAKFPVYYQLKYVDYATEVPTTSSMYDITDYSVPFYQMVVSGSLVYTSPALNFEGDIHDALMRTIETGSVLYYTFIYKDPYELKDTWYEFLYGASYENGFGSAVAAYNELTGVYEKLGTNVLRGHERLAEGVTASTYETGKKIIFNYTEREFVTEQGVKVPADSYVIVSEEGSVL